MTRIDVLPDDVLLTIFNFYIVGYLHTKPVIEEWQSLVHGWRSIVFGSPRHLNLRLFCTPETPVRDTLDVWPALPLLINGDISSASSVDNIVAALGHNNRVREVDLGEIAGLQLEKVLVAMQMPFPEVTHLRLAASMDDQTLPAVPDSFLGGSASCPAILLIGRHTISGVVKIPFVRHSPRRSSSPYSSIWLYFTRGDCHLPLYVDKPRQIYP